MDDLSFLSKTTRFLKTTQIIGGLGTRLIGEQYFNHPINDEEYSKILKKSLGQLKGPLVKIAQFLTTIPDTLPIEYYELMELQSKAPSMGVPFVKRRMQTELGNNWQEKFESFEMNAVSAASLGQVHKAVHKNGSVVAVKLQYPGMQDAINTDLMQFRMLLKTYEKFNNAIETQNIFDEIKEKLLEELDYEIEKKNIIRYEKFFKNNPSIIVPDVYEELSTKRLLTMGWIEGKNILHYVDSTQETKNKLGELLFRAWYEPFYKIGLLHADPHPGNYLVLEDPNLKLALLDFGCVRHFPFSFIQGVKDLYTALETNNRDLAVFAFEQWGFKNLTKELIDIIIEWAKLLYDPLLDDSIRAIQKNKTGKESFEIASKIHQKLKEAGGISPPKEFVFMDRAAVGIGSVLMRINAKANWHKLFLEFIQP